MNPTQVRLTTIFGIKKTFLTQDNLDHNIFLFVESDMYSPTPTVALCRYLLTLFKESRFQCRI